jgi:hypothetical protein
METSRVQRRPKNLLHTGPLGAALALALLSCISACNETKKSPPPSPTVAPAQTPEAKSPQAKAIAPASAPAAPKLGIEWDVPEGWKEDTKPRMMRAATYYAPGAKGNAEVSVFFFGQGQGGDVEANITRWVSQFQNVPKNGVKRAESEANGLKRFTVSIAQGDFASGMPGQPQGQQTDWGMEGAIVETPTGSYYFKMVGPADSVKEQASAFLLLLDSIKVKG